MNKLKIIIIIGIIMFIARSLFAERLTGVTLYSSINGMHTMPDDNLDQPDWTYGGEVASHIVITPSLSYEENLQPDARLDAYLSRSLDSNEINLSVREAFIDLLFYDMLSIKSGFMKIDYGYNSYFHPLNITEFVPEMRDLYNKISIGNEDMGYKGVPAAKIRFFLPDIFDNLKISLDQSMAWIDFNHLNKNYYLSSISCSYINYNLGFVTGYTGKSWRDDPDRKLPVYGVSFSAALPFEFLLFWEGLYKKESYRSYVQENQFMEKRGNKNLLNTSVRLETIKKEPVFNNNISINIEYFYYGEGLTRGMYNDIYEYLLDSDNLYNYGTSLIINERNFRNYLRAEISYNFNAKGLGIGYNIINEMESGMYNQELSIRKTYKNVGLMASVVYMRSREEKYELTHGNKDWCAYFTMMMEL